MAEWLIIQVVRILIGCALGALLAAFVTWPYWVCALICTAVVYGVWIIIIDGDGDIL